VVTLSKLHRSSPVRSLSHYPVALEPRAIPRIQTNLFPAIQTKILEALHHAGPAEYPVDRNAMTSPEINRMVKKKCGF